MSTHKKLKLFLTGRTMLVRSIRIRITIILYIFINRTIKKSKGKLISMLKEILKYHAESPATAIVLMSQMFLSNMMKAKIQHPHRSQPQL